MKRLVLAVILAGLAISGLGRSYALSTDDLRETHRIRIVNSVDGPVQVSADQGKSYITVGRVTRPATACIQGFAASVFAKDGRVAAIAVHALRVRSGSIRGRDGEIPQIFSIIPREFAKPGGEFGTGEIAGASGIYTDIPAGTAIFRNLSPLVGNPVFQEDRQNLRPLPKGYVPKPGDILVIVAQIHERRPSEIVIENRSGGAVEAVYGNTRETIAVVEHPVLGIGRFDATEYTGVGCINTNHTGVVTISTAPIRRTGAVSEPRGGFQILPSRHAKHIGWIPQYMVVAPATPKSPGLEGSPLLFSDYIGLEYDPESPQDSTRVDIRIGGADEWRPLSSLVGKQDDALIRLVGNGKPVTHIRLRLPAHGDDWTAMQLRRSADAYVKAKYGNKPPAKGVISFCIPQSAAQDAALASLYVDGAFRGISSNPPFAFDIDTAKLPPGEHCVEIRTSGSTGAILRSSKQWFYTTGG